MTPITLTVGACRELAALLRSPPGRESRRAQALLWLARGFPPGDIADLLAVSRQTVYNWANRFQEHPELDLAERLADAPRSGRPPAGLGSLDARLEAAIDLDPQTFGFRYATWTAPLLCRYLDEFHDLRVSRKTVSRALDRLALRWKRPRHQLALRPQTWRQSKGGSSAGSRAGPAPYC